MTVMTLERTRTFQHNDYLIFPDLVKNTVSGVFSLSLPDNGNLVMINSSFICIHNSYLANDNLVNNTLI